MVPEVLAAAGIIFLALICFVFYMFGYANGYRTAQENLTTSIRGVNVHARKH